MKIILPQTAIVKTDILIPVEKFLTRPYLKAYSGLSINISAAWFIAPFIGSNISFPNSVWDFAVLFWDLTFGILFLLVTVWCERRLQR